MKSLSPPPMLLTRLTHTTSHKNQSPAIRIFWSSDQILALSFQKPPETSFQQRLSSPLPHSSQSTFMFHCTITRSSTWVVTYALFLLKVCVSNFLTRKPRSFHLANPLATCTSSTTPVAAPTTPVATNVDGFQADISQCTPAM